MKTVEHLGIAVRFKTYSKNSIAVEQCPLCIERYTSRKCHSHDENVWGTFGGYPGMSSSEFNTLAEAKQFYDDLTIIKDVEKLAKKYPNLITL